MSKLLSLVFSLFCLQLNAQKFMSLPDTMKSAALHYDIRMKSGVGYMRYQFGEYELKNGKKGWSTSTTTYGTNSLFNILFLAREQQTRIKEKSSFSLVQKEKDTAFVQVAINTSLRYTDYSQHLIKIFRHEKELESSSASYVAVIRTTLDTTEWMLSTFTEEKDFESWNFRKDFRGWLTDGLRVINLRPVFAYDDGKEHVTGEMLGCIFEEEGRPIAAIQFLGPVFTNFQKQNHIWLPQTDSAFNLVLAAASTALMARAHQMRP